ncbi:MAG TPA: hypothetical protein VEC11_07740 [Allosphingosinicella sp.]|nr:hypothetical protein [Allosphingosinicella sp.]
MTQNNMARLLEAGFDQDDAVRIATEAVTVFDGNRKARGAISGPIGATGTRAYEALARTDDFDPDVQAFFDLRPFTVDMLAAKIRSSRGATGSAVSRLIRHGFVEKVRTGRGFSVRPLVPDVALKELGVSWSTTDAPPGTWAYECRAWGELIIKMLNGRR